MPSLGGWLIVTCELMIEIDPHRAGEVTGLKCGAAVAPVEVPANVCQHCFGVGANEVGIDEGRDHWTSRSASAAACARTSRNGRPSAWAAAAASSYSTFTRPSATLARTL